MLEKRLIKTLKDSLNNAVDENKYLRKQLISILEDAVMTINQIQDVQAIGISENEKDIMRNIIINKKRTDYVTKIIELDGSEKSSNSK